MLKQHDFLGNTFKKTSNDITVAKALNEQLGNSNGIGETMYAKVSIL